MMLDLPPLKKNVNGIERYFGLIQNPKTRAAYHETLPSGDEYWQKLALADNNGDRYWYRALVHEMVRDNNTRWLMTVNGWPVMKSWNQGQVGSCVGHGEGLKGVYELVLNRRLRGIREDFPTMCSPEFSYWASRKAGGMPLDYQDGSTGEGAALGSDQYGVLPRGIYNGEDISEYSETRCRNWGAGKNLLSEGLAHAVKHKSSNHLLIDTVEKSWLALGDGQIINVCSGVGYQGSRDSEGAIKASGLWSHSMCLIGRRTTAGGKRLTLCMNSWGDNWCTGACYFDQPPGSFYIYDADLARMLREGDSYVSIQFAGDLVSIPTDFTEVAIFKGLGLAWSGRSLTQYAEVA